MRLSTIPYITLWVHHFDECVRFYRDKLGLNVERHDPNFIQFATEGTRLYLHRSADVSPLRRDVLEIHFAVSDVDAPYQQLQSQAVAFECAPQNMP